MKSRKEKFIEYQDKYGNIPHDYRERLNYMCDKYKLSPKRMMEIISTRNSILNSMYYKSLKICLYEEPEGTPRPRARLINRYNILDVSKADSNFIQIYSITGKADNMYMKKLVSQNDYLEANELIYTPCDVCVNVYFKPSDLMLITDHINFMGTNPLIGPNDESLGTRFPDMSEVYTKELKEKARACAKKLGIDLQEGVYMALTGPTYETPAEVKMVRFMGADAVGMSTVPEAIVACYCGMEVLGLSCICNSAAGISTVGLSHKEVLEAAEAAKSKFKNLVLEVIKDI